MRDTPVTVVIEDDLSLSIVKKLVTEIECKYYIEKSIPEIRRKNVARGNAYIKEKINAFNKAAQYLNFIILTDLDFKECAPSYVNELFDSPIKKKLLFQIAVREVESWLIADTRNFSSFMGVPKDLFKEYPEIIMDPKEYIFSIAKKSRKREIRKGILPKDKTARIGPMYNQLLINFVQNNWDYNKAKSKSNSLNRFINKISK